MFGFPSSYQPPQPLFPSQTNGGNQMSFGGMTTNSQNALLLPTNNQQQQQQTGATMNALSNSMIGDDWGAKLLLQKLGVTISPKIIDYFQNLLQESEKEHEQLKQEQQQKLAAQQQEEESKQDVALSWFGLGGSSSTNNEEKLPEIESIDSLFRKKLDQIRSLPQNDMEELATQLVGVDNKRFFTGSVEGLISFYAKSASRVIHNSNPHRGMIPQMLVVKVPGYVKFIHRLLTSLAQRIRENLNLVKENQTSAMENEILQGLFSTILAFTQIEDIVNLPTTTMFDRHQERDPYRSQQQHSGGDFSKQSITTNQAQTIPNNIQQGGGSGGSGDLSSMFQSNMVIRDNHLFPGGGGGGTAPTQLPSTNSAFLGNSTIPFLSQQQQQQQNNSLANHRPLFRHSFANVTTSRRMDDDDDLANHLTDEEVAEESRKHKKSHHHQRKTSLLDRLEDPNRSSVQSEQQQQRRHHQPYESESGSDYSSGAESDTESGSETEDDNYSSSDSGSDFEESPPRHHHHYPPPPPSRHHHISRRHRH
jgi:hypothetical protein